MYKFNVYPYGKGFAVDFKYSCADHSIKEETKFNFNWTDENQAIQYAKAQFGKWLNEQLVKYVNHADILFNTSKTGFYMTPKKRSSMLRLKDFLRKSGELSPRFLVQQVFTYEQDLINLLPSSGNASYVSTREKLDDIITLCRRYRNKYIIKHMVLS